MAKYGRKAQKEVKKAMHKMKEGELETGTGKKVKNRKQAIAIGLSEAREKGAKVPAKSQRGSAKKSSRPQSRKRSKSKK